LTGAIRGELGEVVVVRTSGLRGRLVKPSSGTTYDYYSSERPMDDLVFHVLDEHGEIRRFFGSALEHADD
jgi:hypothetical protein